MTFDEYRYKRESIEEQISRLEEEKEELIEEFLSEFTPKYSCDTDFRTTNRKNNPYESYIYDLQIKKITATEDGDISYICDINWGRTIDDANWDESEFTESEIDEFIKGGRLTVLNHVQN